MASKVTPSTPGAPSFSLASAYAWRSVSILQTWTYSPQKRQVVSAFALTYSLRLRSCKLMDAFVISSLPSRLKETLQTAGPPRSVGVTPLRRYYGPVRHPLAFDRLRGLAGYTTYLAPVISQPGREGFTNHSMCPCHEAKGRTERHRGGGAGPGAGWCCSLALQGSGLRSGEEVWCFGKRGHHCADVTRTRLLPYHRSTKASRT